MMTRRLFLALPIGLLAACGGSLSGNKAFPHKLIQALLDGNKDNYVRCHVQKGDMTTDGSSRLVVEPGGRVPDDTWVTDVEAAFEKDRATIEGLRKERGSVAYAGVVKTSEEEQTPARRIWSTHVLLKCGDTQYVAELGRSVQTSRGRVLAGPPGLSIKKQ